MELEALNEAITAAYERIEVDLDVAIDEQTRTELALLCAVYDTDDVDDIVRRAIHLFVQHALETGSVDLQLRQRYGLTYDEYLSGMTYDEMMDPVFPAPPDDEERRYRF